MENPKKPKIRTWTGGIASVYSVPISIREYHMRLEQMMDQVYSELRQLSSESKILDPSSRHHLSVINANQTLNQTNQDLIPEEEVFDGVA